MADPATEMVDLGRERLLWAALDQLESEGRGSMSTAALAALADLDEGDFLATFGDVDACLADAYALLTERVGAAVQAGCTAYREGDRGAERDFAAGVRGGVEALLGELTERPRMAHTLTVTYPALGVAEQRRYLEFLTDLSRLLRLRWEADGVDTELPGEVEMLAIGSGEAIVTDEIRAGRGGELAAMAPEILFSILVPYIGAGHARLEMERARTGQ